MVSVVVNCDVTVVVGLAPVSASATLLKPPDPSGLPEGKVIVA